MVKKTGKTSIKLGKKIKRFPSKNRILNVSKEEVNKIAQIKAMNKLPERYS